MVEQGGQWGEAFPLQVNRMKNDTSLTLFHYWNGLRGSRIAPQRLEIEPAHIAGILPLVFVLERMNFEAYRFRIAGTRLCEQFGCELRGHNFLGFWSPEDRFTLKRMLASISQEGLAGLLELQASAPGKNPVPIEMLILPLTHAGEVIDRFIGSMSTEVGSRCNEMEHLHQLRLVRHELFRPDDVSSGRQLSAWWPLSEVRNARLVQVKQRSFRVYEGGRSSRAGSHKD